MRINSYTPTGTLSAETVALSAEESHHLARVLRVAAGQEMTLFDGEGTRAEGRVETVTKKEVTVRILSRATVPPPPVELTLIQALCKPDRFELILQKATELGVWRIQPVSTQNTSLPAGKMEKMAERGAAIIRHAAQQCGTAWLPLFDDLKPIDAVCPMLAAFDAAFIGSLYPGAEPLKQAFGRVSRADGTTEIRPEGVPPALHRIKRAALLIGPEGDFTKEEVDAAVAAGAIPVTFGTQVLRTETAALFGLSVLAYELF